MSEWKAKRFWTKTEAAEVAGGFTVHLDGRPIKTPGKSPLVLPTRAMAQAMAAEWEAQEGQIDPLSMPVTRSANSAVDKVVPQRMAVAEMLAEYGETDLLCYRAESPLELITRQSQGWDPVLTWCAETFSAQMTPVSGVMYAPQPETSLEALRAQVRFMDAFSLTGFHDLVTLPGSFVLGLAAIHGYATPEELWELSRLDERYQQEQWGTDEEAEEAAQLKQAAFVHALDFYRMSQR